MEVSGKTDVGRRRKLNEDKFLVDADTNLFAVCDGMGGHNAGEVASRMAIETLAAFIERSHKEKDITWPYGLEPALSFEANRLKTAIQLANKKVFKAADNREDYTGMGTTLVAALVTGRTVTVGSAGDSRCYSSATASCAQLTRDDSWVSAAWAEGILSPDEIDAPPAAQRHHQGDGRQGRRSTSTSSSTGLEPGDVVLLCSDGLHAMINDEEILAASRPSGRHARRDAADG